MSTEKKTVLVVHHQIPTEGIRIAHHVFLPGKPVEVPYDLGKRLIHIKGFQAADPEIHSNILNELQADQAAEEAKKNPNNAPGTRTASPAGNTPVTVPGPVTAKIPPGEEASIVDSHPKKEGAK